MGEISKIDIVVIGAGVVGSAVAMGLSEKFPKKSIVILESGPRPAEGVTSRNSGVVHAGIYYLPGSLKAETCIRGNTLLYEWARGHGVPFRKCGKFIIAKGSGQIDALAKIYENATHSGSLDLRRLSRDEMRKAEPNIEVDEAIWSPWTGIVDPSALTWSFLKKAQEGDAILMTNQEVLTIDSLPSGNFKIQTSTELIEAGLIVNAAGLNSDEIAKMAGVNKYKIYPCRGDYFTFRSKVQFRSLIYPVKEPGAPGLGVHLTIDLDGRQKLGPDAEYVDSKNDFSSAEEKLEKFQTAAKLLFGSDLPFELQYDTCGIRPKLRSPTEAAEKDFVIAKDKHNLINLVGIESPGLTSSLAIAERVTELV